MKKNVLELFAGSRSIGNKAEELGMNVFSVDWTPYEKIDLSIDIELLTKDQVPFIPDVVWASPDCTTYTIAAISHHRNGTEPKSDYALKCDNVNKHWLRLINEWLLINPKMVFFIENPRGMMRKMPFMKGLQRTTVWYCTYGDSRAKPTDIWSNNIQSIFNPNGWNPRAECFNGNKKCQHESAPRGSKTGTQGKKGSYNRSKIPELLCEDVLNSIMNDNRSYAPQRSSALSSLRLMKTNINILNSTKMKKDNSIKQSNASKPMLANRLNEYECYKIKIEKSLTDKQYKDLLIENGIIIKKPIPEKLYFLNIDDTNCYPLSDRLNDAMLEGLDNIILVEAIPDNDNVDYVWCYYYGEVSDRDQCKKSFCPHYESKSGRGACKNRGNLYTHGDEVTFDVPKAVC